MNEVVVIDGQSIYDICIQVYGSLELIPKLLLDNEIGLSDVLTTGQSLKYTTDLSQQVNISTNSGFKSYKVSSSSNKYLPVKHQNGDVIITVNYDGNGETESFTLNASAIEGNDYLFSFPSSGDYYGSIITLTVEEAESFVLGGWTLYVDGIQIQVIFQNN